MKLYTFVAGEMISTEVIKETKARYYIEPSMEFGYYTFVDKDFACTTEDLAAAEAINKATRMIRYFEGKLSAARAARKSAIMWRES